MRLTRCRTDDRIVADHWRWSATVRTAGVAAIALICCGTSAATEPKDGVATAPLTTTCRSSADIVAITYRTLDPRIGTRTSMTPDKLVKLVEPRSIGVGAPRGRAVIADLCGLRLAASKMAPSDVRIGVSLRTSSGRVTTLFADYPFVEGPQVPMHVLVNGARYEVGRVALRQLTDILEQGEDQRD